MDFRSPEEFADLAREVRGLNQTVLDMHRENLDTARVRREGLERRLGEMADAIHALALAIQSGDSKLAQELAVHIATAHHGGTQETLTAHEAHLARHDGEITKIRQRLQVEDGRIAAQTASRGHRYAVLTVLAAIMAAVGAVLGPVLAEIVKAWTALFGSGGHPR